MGEHEASGLLPNGLLPNECASVIRDLDAERWSMAEERTAELIACIQPNQPSEDRRNAVTEYVQRLIMKCFPCQVFTFGSVPLKTYLPDGDIDLTAFSKDQSLKDSWAGQVRDMLESEEKNENAEFRVKEVQYIQAEVKIIKCLVENIVVDISFNQLGGLCTLCFLEEVDNLINQNHLFKRSIILIKAWCYYESRILGAHHGLISTYALETLVLYIFHVFNNSFTGPLEVLYRFLEFFSNFDWDNFCVSLWGPVPISSLPDVTAEPPRKDGGDLLLSKLFLNACTYVYAVFPAGLENQGQPFSSKHFNVIDPLRVNNNLGRSVSKGNFYRIRSAFAFGAKRLARLLECPKESIVFELNQFFMNTWERHGSGIRPDAPTSDVWQLRPSDQNPPLDNNQWNASSRSLKTDRYTKDEYPSVHEVHIEGPSNARSLSSQQDSFLVESTCESKDFVHTQGEKGHFNPNSSNQRSWKLPDQRVNEVQGRYLFARTRSSPELTDVYSDNTSSSRRRGSNNNNNSKAPAESGKPQMRKKNTASETVSTHSTTTASSSDDHPLSARHVSSSHHQMMDASTAADSNSISGGGGYEEEESGSRSTTIEDYRVMMGAHGMRQEEQDLVNLMASSSSSSSMHHHNFAARQIPLPVNLGPTVAAHLPMSISPSVLATMGYATQRTAIAGMVPTNIPLIDPYWAAGNLQFHQGGLMSSPQFFPGGVGLAQNMEDLSLANVGSSEMVVRGEADAEYWQQERDPSSTSNGEIHSDERQLSTSGSLLEAQGRVAREGRVSARDDYVSLASDSEDRISSAKFCSASQSGSVRSSKTSSESSWDGSSSVRGGVSKAARDKRGRKTGRSTAPAAAPSFNNNNNNNVYGGKGKNVYEDAGPAEADEESSRDWIEERVLGPNHSLLSSEVTLASGSAESAVGPIILGRQRGPGPDGSGVVPFTFYPTGPPVPFLTMLHFPTNPGASDASSGSNNLVGAHEAPDSGQNFDPSEAHNAPPPDVMRNVIMEEPSEEVKGGDILNSDFASHWQNLQFGRLCQGPRYPASPVMGPSQIMVPPMYLQARVPWDGPGRPTLSHLVNYGPRFAPMAPVQSVSVRPVGGAVFQPFGEDVPRYRSGTGTYLPNPKASVRDRHPSGTRRNSYNNYDRTDHADREGNWNAAKARAAARNHSRQNQVEKSRVDRLPAANETRVDQRPWVRHHESALSSYQAQNGPVQPIPSSSSHGSSAGAAMAAYGMYPLPGGMNPGGLMSNGPSVVMLYPYDQNSGYVSPGEGLEFGSIGPVGGSIGPVGIGGGVSDGGQTGDGGRVRGHFVEQRHHHHHHGGSSTQHSSSPDQPSSPHFQRSLAQRTPNYQLKDEDFPPLLFHNRAGGGGGDGERVYHEKQPHHQTLLFASQT